MLEGNKLNFEKIKYFISASEFSSFSKAAEQNYISQAAMSQQISSLEKELDVKLFNRSHTQISLTEEGQIFYEESKKILKQYNRALDKIVTFKKKNKKTISIGYSSALEKDILVSALQGIKLADSLKLKFNYLSLPELKQGLMDGWLELVLTLNTDFPSVIEKRIIFTGEIVVGVSKNHKLAKKITVETGDLKREKFIMFEGGDNEKVAEKIIEHCLRDGFRPDVVETVSSMEDLALLVQLNEGIAFFPNTQQYICNDNIQFVQMKETLHKLEICVAWKKKEQIPEVKELIKALDQSKL